MKHTVKVIVNKSDTKNLDLSKELQEQSSVLAYDEFSNRALAEAKQNLQDQEYLKLQLFYYSDISSTWNKMATYYKEDNKTIVHL